MISNESFYCFAKKTKCYIHDNIIKPFPFSADNVMHTYNPFEELKNSTLPLYSLFASIKVNTDIINFVEKYGFLGLHFDILNYKNWFEFSNTALKNINFYNNYSESVDEFMKEVLLMNATLELIEAFSNNTKSLNEISKTLISTNEIDRDEELERKADYTELQNKIDNVYKLNGRTMDSDFKNISKHPRLVAPDLIIKEIEIKLIHVNLRLNYSVMKEAFIENRIVPNLLTSMYLMLYEDLTMGKRFVRCSNKTCNRWFTIDTNHNKKYCEANCERAEKQRRYREHLKNKGGIANVSN